MRKLVFILIFIIAVTAGSFAQDLKIDFKVDISGATRSSYFTFTGPIRYMAVEQDHYDGVSAASLKGSTHLFQPYRNDVEGKKVFPDGLRGLFLFGVAGADQAKNDGLKATKASNGVITIEYSHRGSLYKIVTDRNGNISLTDGAFQKTTDGMTEADVADPSAMFYWKGNLKAALSGSILTVNGELDAVKR